MVDLSFLETFTKGNTDKMKRYISMYLKTAPEALDRMEKNIKNNSWPELAINAHSLKPQAEFMGLNDLKSVLIEIENKVKDARVDDMESLFELAKNIHKESEIFLQNFNNKD